MSVYQIEIKETLSRVLDIEAESLDDALCKAKSEYKSCDVILDADDCVDFEIIPYEDKVY